MLFTTHLHAPSDTSRTHMERARVCSLGFWSLKALLQLPLLGVGERELARAMTTIASINILPTLERAWRSRR